VAFLIPGQGSQYAGMAARLYRREPVFRHWLDRCCAGLAPWLDRDLRPLLFDDGPDAAAVLPRTDLAQPALFAVSYALARTAMEWGVAPVAMLGHSIGEYVAACLADVFTLDAALALIAARGRLMQSLPGGAMLAVALSEHEVVARLDPRLSLAAVNAPRQCVVAGDVAAIADFAARLDADGVATHRLATSHGFHSAQMDPILEAFVDRVRDAGPRAPARPFVSNVTGDWIDAAAATDPRYWARHLREPVRFHAGLETLTTAGPHVLLEIGPGRSLGRLVERAGAVALATLPDSAKAADPLPSSLAKLWVAGVPIAWDRFHEGRGRRRVDLPLYPFERRRHFVDPPRHTGPSTLSTSKATDPAQWFYLPEWRREPMLALDAPGAPRSWLVFTDESAFASALETTLRAAGHRLTTVVAGDGFLRKNGERYVICADAPEDYERLLQALAADERVPTDVLHLWALSRRNSPVATVLDLGVHALIHFARAIGAVRLVHPLSLTMVTRGAQDVIGDEPLDPAAAAALGAIKVIPLEYATIRCRVVDLPPDRESAETERLVSAIVSETRDTSDLPIVALRGGHRWLPGVRQVPLAATDAITGLRPGGHYVITGGTGGMGRAIARDLAARCKAHLTLVARRPPDEGAEGLLEEIASFGGDVRLYAADVADEAALERTLAAARRVFGPIHGVVHAAGVVDDAGVIARRSRAETDAALAAKVTGTLALDRLVAADRPDFMLLCSTLGSVLYRSKFGQVGYAAANEFLDVFAIARERRGGGRTIVVNWDDWAETGMSERASQRWRAVGVDPATALTPAEGVEVFHRALASPHARVIVSVRDLPAVLAERDMPVLSAAPATASSVVVATDRVVTPPETETERLLAAVWENVLGITPVGREDDFFELGGHSLMATRIIATLRAQYRLELPLAAIFEAPTLGALAALVDGLRGATTTENAGEAETEFVV
jgi:acyl transferase domain-containing protein